MQFGSVDAKKWIIGSGVFLVLFFVFTDAEGSVQGHFLIRLGQWTLNVFLTLAILVAVQSRLNHWTPLARSSPWLAVLIGGLVGSLLFSPIALALDVLFAENVLRDSSGPEWAGAWLDELFGVLKLVTLAWLAINAPAILRLDFDSKRPMADKRADDTAIADLTHAGTADDPTSALMQSDGAAPTPDRPTNPFLDLLPERIGQDVAWIKSELHYINVVTPRGKALLLYNLSDAVQCMPDDAGMMTHRSYWVAYHHVERYVTNNGRSELIMMDGKRIPVARRRQAEVRKRIGL